MSVTTGLRSPIIIDNFLLDGDITFFFLIVTSDWFGDDGSHNYAENAVLSLLIFIERSWMTSQKPACTLACFWDVIFSSQYHFIANTNSVHKRHINKKVMEFVKGKPKTKTKNPAIMGNPIDMCSVNGSKKTINPFWLVPFGLLLLEKPLKMHCIKA